MVPPTLIDRVRARIASVALHRCIFIVTVQSHFHVERTNPTIAAYHTRMPATKKVNKTPCSLCHKVVQELTYHYDICEPCHQNGDVLPLARGVGHYGQSDCSEDESMEEQVQSEESDEDEFLSSDELEEEKEDESIVDLTRSPSEVSPSSEKNC